MILFPHYFDSGIWSDKVKKKKQNMSYFDAMLAYLCLNLFRNIELSAIL